jgi:hypothetical protein
MTFPSHKVEATSAETLDRWHWPCTVVCLDGAFRNDCLGMLSFVGQRKVHQAVFERQR